MELIEFYNSILQISFYYYSKFRIKSHNLLKTELVKRSGNLAFIFNNSTNNNL